MNLAGEITIMRSKLYPQPGRVSKYQWVWYYECEGPDGRQFNNRDVSTLRSVLKRRYGLGVRIIEPWKNRAATKPRNDAACALNVPDDHE